MAFLLSTMGAALFPSPLTQPTSLIASTAELILRARLRTVTSVDVDVDGSGPELLGGGVQGVRIRGTNWCTPMSLSCRTLDISVMYWNLLVADDDDDIAQNSSEADALGAWRGAQLFAALDAAAARGVRVRFLQDGTTTSLGHPAELDALAAAHPETVSVGKWNATDWYGE